ncbi:MAG: hypothetical protein WD489_09245 [Rhodovibrionaceae bacterium]
MTREFAASKTKLRHGLLIAALVAALGFWVLFFAGALIPDHRLVGGVNLALALIVAGYAWQSSQASGLSLKLDEDGIWYKEWGFTLPWREVADIYAKGSRLNPLIALQLKDSSGFLDSLPAERVRKLKAGPYYKQPQLLLPNACADASFAELLSVLQAGLAQARKGSGQA